MIDVNLIDSTIASGAGTNYYAVCMQVPVIYGATATTPQITTTFTLGTPTQGTGVVYIPVTATISLKYVCEQGLVVKQQELYEHFTVGFVGTSLPTSAVLNNLGFTTTYTKTKCCKSYGMRLDGAISLVVA